MIEIKNLTYTYADAKLPAVNDFTLTINNGEFIALIGRSGSGKSTLAKHLNALLLPQNGSVSVDGLGTRDKNAWAKIRANVGMLWQNPEHQFVASILREDVAFAPENFGLSIDEINSRVDEALHAVNLTALAESDPYLLSGGEQQRGALAGILAMRPQYLILDEPVSATDAVASREIFALLKNLQANNHCTVLMITHSLDDALRYAQRIIIMDAGKLRADLTTTEILAQPQILTRYDLPIPFCLQLAMKFSPLPSFANLTALEEWLLNQLVIG